MLAAIVEDLGDRSSVLIGLPGEMPGPEFAVEVADLIKHGGIGRWEAVRSDEACGTAPEKSLARRPNGSGDIVFWVDATGEDAAATKWADCVRQFAGVAETPRICIAMSTACAEACKEDKGLRRRIWQDFVTASDSRVLVERHGRRSERSPAHIALKSALIAELAGPDLPFAERLARMPLGRIFAANEHPPERIWAAQVSILFPLVERERRRLLDVYRELWHLHLPHTRENGKEIQHAENLEIGDMAALARWNEAFETERRHLRWLQDVRNALAHNRIVPWQKLVDPIALQIEDFRE